jgi:hypothetical protein
MNRGLRVLRGTLWHKENEERRSGVGDGKDEPVNWKLSTRRWG